MVWKSRLLGWLRSPRHAPRPPPSPPAPPSLPAVPPPRSLYRVGTPAPGDANLPWPPSPRFAGWTVVAVMDSNESGYARYLVDPPGASGPRCALACFAPDRADPFFPMRFDELGVARLLAHPNLERVVDRGGGDGIYWHLTERPAGPTARALHPRRPFELPDLDVVLAAFADFAEGLHAAHTLVHRGIVLELCHRTLTEDALLLGADGVGRVVDWGLTEMIRCAAPDGGGHAQLGYLAPEQVRGAAVDGRADVHALGAMLHTLTTGDRLFEGDTEVETLENLLHARPTPPSWIVPGYPPALEDLVLGALAKDPADRPAAGALAAGLRDLLAARGVTDPAARLAAYVRVAERPSLTP